MPYEIDNTPRDAVRFLPAGRGHYVVAGGHTELALPLPVIGGPLAALNLGFANTRYLVFGWGARDYMARDPGSETCCGRPFRDRQSCS
jgi:hypothetical protein